MSEEKFLEIDSTPGKHTVKIVEKKTKDWEHYTNLVDKGAVYERTDFNTERSSTVGKMLSNSIAGRRRFAKQRDWETPEKSRPIPTGAPRPPRSRTELN